MSTITTYVLEGLDTDGTPTKGGEATRASPPDAVRLFEAIARRKGTPIDPAKDRSAIAEFCRTVGGAPLAIELAAAWSGALPVSVVLERWERDLSERPVPGETRSASRDTLRHAIEVSWSLLQPGNRAALARLGVFAHGWTIEAAETVAGVGLARLAELRDTSWIAISRHGRVTHHPAVASVLHKLLAEHGGVSERLRDQHARYYLEQLQLWEDLGQNRDPVEALLAIRREHANIERAWSWAVDRGLWAPLSAGGAFLGLSYALAGDDRTWESMLGHACAHTPDDHPTKWLLYVHVESIRAFEGQVHLAYRACRTAAHRIPEDADPKIVGWIAYHLGIAARNAGKIDEARTALERSAKLWRTTAEVGLETMAIGAVTRLARTREEHERWYARGEDVGSRRDRALPAARSEAAEAAVERARVLAMEDGAYREAIERATFAVDVHRELGWNQFNLAIALSMASDVHRVAGNITGAVRDAEAAVTLIDGFTVRNYADSKPALLAHARALWCAGEHDAADAVLERLGRTPSSEVFRARLEHALARGDLESAALWIDTFGGLPTAEIATRRDLWQAAELSLLLADHAARVSEAGAARRTIVDVITTAWRERFIPTTLHALALAVPWLTRPRAQALSTYVARHASARWSTRHHPSLHRSSLGGDVATMGEEDLSTWVLAVGDSLA